MVCEDPCLVPPNAPLNDGRSSLVLLALQLQSYGPPTNGGLYLAAGDLFTGSSMRNLFLLLHLLLFSPVLLGLSCLLATPTGLNRGRSCVLRLLLSPFKLPTLGLCGRTA